THGQVARQAVTGGQRFLTGQAGDTEGRNVRHGLDGAEEGLVLGVDDQSGRGAGVRRVLYLVAEGATTAQGDGHGPLGKVREIVGGAAALLAVDVHRDGRGTHVPGTGVAHGGEVLALDEVHLVRGDLAQGRFG